MQFTILETTDSYKLSHFGQYPPGSTRASSYIESRGGAFANARFFGLQGLLKLFFTKPIAAEDVARMAELAQAHGMPFDRDGWMHIVDEHGGRLPLRIDAVPEGTDVPIGNVLVQVENTCDRTAWLTSYVETILMHVWYPTTVCTVSAQAKATIAAALERTAEDPLQKSAFMLHDFGARGVSSVESAALGGLAHLVNFRGTDTVAALVAGRELYNEPMAGFSIPAMEHSTVTSWGRGGEERAFRNMLATFGGPGKTLAMVVDSYDTYAAVDETIGVNLKEAILASGTCVVVRPDSGDPNVVVPRILRSLARNFGHEINHKGFAVLNPAVRVIQGDGMDLDAIRELYEAVERAEFSAENVTVGMGGGLLQKVNRDTMRFAMKCSAIAIDGSWIDVYKDPKTDPGKRSKRGRLALVANGSAWSDYTVKTGFETVRLEALGGRENLLRTVYRDGALVIDESLATIRDRAARGERAESLA
jgi:nicotinamide phosphoribosyltransferase